MLKGRERFIQHKLDYTNTTRTNADKADEDDVTAAAEAAADDDDDDGFVDKLIGSGSNYKIYDAK